MKHVSFAFVVLALCLVPLASARAQDAGKSDSVKYDTVMEKRADLRVKYQRAVRGAAQQTAAPEPDTNNSRARLPRAHINGNYRVDFMARSAKRADLRVQISQLGMDRAYAEWMLREHGH